MLNSWSVMKRPRTAVLEALNTYVSQYDLCDERIELKVRHTHEGAQLCDDIAHGEGLSAADVDLAWLCGLLHDIAALSSSADGVRSATRPRAATLRLVSRFSRTNFSSIPLTPNGWVSSAKRSRVTAT